MPQGVKSNLSAAEKYELHLQRCKEYKKNRRANDPEYLQRCKEYNTQYFKNLREAGLAERAKQKESDKEN